MWIITLFRNNIVLKNNVKTVVGKVTDGEFHTLRSLNSNSEAQHIWQLVHDARLSVSKMSKQTLTAHLTLSGSKSCYIYSYLWYMWWRLLPRRSLSYTCRCKTFWNIGTNGCNTYNSVWNINKNVRLNGFQLLKC